MSGQEPELPPLDTAHELAPETAEPAHVEEVRRLTAERDALQDRLLRALADADNYRKRVQRELQDTRAHAISEAVRPFLPVLDGFDRAAQHAHAPAADVRTGLERLHRQLEEALRKAGLEPIAAVGQPFDPHLHQAVEMVDSEDAPEGAVVEELQRGYRWRDRLIRPAMVKVARAKS